MLLLNWSKHTLLFHVCDLESLYLLPVSVLFTGLDKPHLKFIVCSEVSVYIWEKK